MGYNIISFADLPKTVLNPEATCTMLIKTTWYDLLIEAIDWLTSHALAVLPPGAVVDLINNATIADLVSRLYREGKSILT